MNSTGTCAWRVYPLMQELLAQGHKCEAVNIQGFTEEEMHAILEWSDVLTFQMVAARDLVERAKEKGVYTIFDCDDFINKVPPKHPSFEITQDKSYQRLFRRMMRQVDLITVSSQPLLDHYKRYNDHIKLLPNFIPDGFWERPQNPNHSSTLRIGWAGGVSHQEDLEFIAPVMTEVITENPTTKFVYTGGGGWGGSFSSTFLYGNDHFPQIPLNRREYNPGSRIEMWPDRLNSMQLDIALAPLEENEFSICKTHIKYFEYGINHWPGVYQKFLYGDVVKHGETGFLATTPEEWKYYIDLLTQDKDLREKMGEAAYNDVKQNHTFEKNKEIWLETYQVRQ
jgi:hypothetical protein